MGFMLQYKAPWGDSNFIFYFLALYIRYVTELK